MGVTEGFTVDCILVCGNAVFLFRGVVSVGWMEEMLCCVVVVIVSTISSLMKCDEVWISFCVQFFVPFKFSCVILKVEFKLLFPVLSVNFALKLKGVASTVSGVILT